MNFLEFISLFGTVIILIAFALNQKHIWNEDYLIYDFINFFGSVLLFYYSYEINSLAFMLLNFVWGGLSLRDCFYDLTRNAKRKNSKHFFSKWLT